jgi:predicted nucleic acid-binding Zn ribbon protein
MDKPAHKPEPIGQVLAEYLKTAGLADRVQQSAVIPEWPRLVGPEIAAVTEPLVVTSDGTLFVAVASSPWMAELTLIEPALLKTLNAQGNERPPVTKIRYRLRG